MLRFILNRLLLIVPTFVGITLVAFLFIRLLPMIPGFEVRRLLSELGGGETRA